MKICIPIENNKGLASKVFGHFGSAPYFLIYDTEEKSSDVIENKNEHHAHGMCQPMNALAGKKIDAVVSGGMGARAVEKLNAGGIRAYRVIPGTVADIVDQFLKGGLEEMTVNNACIQHNCH
ncbi:MAG: diguanylate cyclase [Omnitrophica bacterium RIFCSPLOWO2_12_FULL_44_17]|uniref:Diguanylate cyclase n=1 Tax=Candidatus Danuiimicrobium aquiferis TaxID=1801832 RepID=A0A1G1KYU2_9BACT|nr:MAG: diguanylate cyclase [Omnitrophica bacterium RIFCSPHIGHO2_02_FULL_45_28]OGW91462.1 MAG: diguanylate cyclase [Omnitrophica bacterium RIFCSPHIGHO2_12_FULL_44_12]OGW98086.1 MAG: diguanylate cyclase [Omnitrophica bacterium RIFCSPLOWO2_12_FULL_44_17]OGX03472.1 MAG: diguanylate cyclase [Omnitrophica bacterium RIFCSPLOWO2_02_FULL_44_11]